MITKQDLVKDISNWNNYWPLLWECLEATGGDVIECGMGDGSTKQLHDYCKERKRLLYSYEYDFQWFKKFKDLRTEWHDIVYIYGEDKKWDFVNERHVAISLLFIDHSPGERRKVDIELFAWKADIIICHDSEPSADFGYQMRDRLAKFKYIKEYEVEKGAWTTAVSNFIDVTKFNP